MTTSKELLGKHAKAYNSLRRWKAEVELKYTKDPVGMKLCGMYAGDIERFLEDITTPLQEAQDFNDMLDLRGIARFGVSRIDRAVDYLLEQKAKIDGSKNKVISLVKGGKFEVS
jgi:hypothetical protein